MLFGSSARVCIVYNGWYRRTLSYCNQIVLYITEPSPCKNFGFKIQLIFLHFSWYLFIEFLSQCATKTHGLLIHLLPSVIFVLRNRVRNHAVNSEQRLQGNLSKLSEMQDKPQRAYNEMTVAVLDNIILPGFDRDLLSFCPKHPIRDKFKELYFLADIKILIRNLRENNVPGEKLFEIEAAAKWYSKNIRETPVESV